MRKIIFLLLLSFAAIGCRKQLSNLKPIEHYRGSVVVELPSSGYENTTSVVLKTQDTIYQVEVIDFDAKNLKVGDTIK